MIISVGIVGVQSFLVSFWRLLRLAFRCCYQNDEWSSTYPTTLKLEILGCIHAAVECEGWRARSAVGKQRLDDFSSSSILEAAIRHSKVPLVMRIADESVDNDNKEATNADTSTCTE